MSKRWKIALRILVVAWFFFLVTVAVGSWDEECATPACPVETVPAQGCLPDGSCQGFSDPRNFLNAGGGAESPCLGDGDGDGIDDGCGCVELATACCLPHGCQDAVEPTTCEAMDGMPFGACTTCDEFECPPGGCIGATEPCGEPHPGTGCNDPYCCRFVCRTDPQCCQQAGVVPATSAKGLLTLAVAVLVLGALIMARWARS